MRDLKFRAWDKSRSKFHNSGNLQLEIGGGSGLFWQFGYTSEPIPYKEQENWILQQFTGLKDKNGKDIFEGDIYVTQFEKMVNKKLGYKLYDKPEHKVIKWGRCGFSPLENAEFIEVVGNIYENPELLDKCYCDEQSQMDGFVCPIHFDQPRPMYVQLDEPMNATGSYPEDKI